MNLGIPEYRLNEWTGLIRDELEGLTVGIQRMSGWIGNY